MRIGVHVTISPTPLVGVENAKMLGANIIQIFTHNPRGWSFKPINKNVLNEFKEATRSNDISPVVSHCNYLINLAASDDTKWQKSLWCLREELRYAKEFGCDYFVLHVGKHLGAGLDEGIKQVIKGLSAAGKDLRESGVTLLLETVAGQGTEVGVDFKDLNRIIEGMPKELRDYVGVCFDTCHVFAAGYELRTKEGISRTMAAIGESFGFDKIKLIHINDSKGDLGSHLDRHEHIGRGMIGINGFKELLSRKEFRKPMILETPHDDIGGYEYDLKVLRERVL